MTTFEAAEKFFLGDQTIAKLPGGVGARLIPRSRSPVDGDSSGEEANLLGDDVYKRTATTWLRRHVKKRLGGGLYVSNDSFFSRSGGRAGFPGAGSLGPLFEEREGPRSHHHNYHQLALTDRQLVAPDASLPYPLRRFNSSLSLLSSGGQSSSDTTRSLGAGFSGGRAGRFRLKMTTVGGTRLYRSSPQLNKSKVPTGAASVEKLPTINSASMPSDINTIVEGSAPAGGLFSSSSRLPSISDTHIAEDAQSNALGNIKSKRRKKVKGPGGKKASSDGATASTATMATGSSKHTVKGSTTTATTTGNDDEDEFETDDEEGSNIFLQSGFTTTTESAYVPREGTPDSQLREAERQAEEEVRHNWLLDEENKSRMKRFESRKNRLTIHVSDEDTVDAIEDRLEELRMMAKPRKDERSVLDRLTQEQRERILRMNEMPIATVKKARRKGWKEAILMARAVKYISRPIHKLRWASSIILLMSRGIQNRRQYVNQPAESGQMRRRVDGNAEPEPTTDTSTPDKPSLGLDLLLALTTRPHLRTTKTVRRILWLLRATKAFKNLFPAEMEMELAKVVGYERYDNGRIISKQGRAPDRFYYIISGKVGLFRQYQLSTGQVTKGMGFLTKGMTTDPELMEKQLPREDSLVAKGQVEVLIVDKDAFEYLQHTTVGPPIDFLKSLDLFEEFPVERFTFSPEAIEYTYYGTGKVIVKDSNRTPWLHIVKSGQVKVVRAQPVIDARASNESKFVTPRIEALGCGKPFSHADAMLGVQAKQRKLKSTAQITLPQITREEPLVSNPFGTTLGVEVVASPSHDAEHDTASRISPVSRPSKKSQRNNDLDEDDEQNESTETIEKTDIPTVHEEHVEEAPNQPSTKDAEGDTQESGEDQGSDAMAPPDVDAARQSATQGNYTAIVNDVCLDILKKELSTEKRRRKEATLPIINIPIRDVSDDYHPHPLWLTRERTDETTGFNGPNHKRTKEQAHRQAYLQLGVLSPGDVFGLDHMQPALASEAQGVSLLSDGAEVIKISKRFFLQNAGNNTMLKVETMCNEYISEEEAQDVLFNKETWAQYKAALWERMTSQLTPVSSR